MSLFETLSEKEEVQVPEIENDDAAYAYYRQRAAELANDPNFDITQADQRFSTSLNLRKVRDALVVIVGAGGLGNWQWLILASMGFRRIAIFDDDVVGIENIGPQAHSVFNIGLPKVEAAKRACLAYRGFELMAYNRRVSTLNDIYDALGEMPKVVITCTDSAEFRNGFILDMWQRGYTDYPDLVLDYRMSLGDWNLFVTPLKVLMGGNLEKKFFRSYYALGVFPPEKAVQEPCTARAISYTGANVASCTGAIMHWLFSEGQQLLNDNEWLANFVRGKTHSPRMFTSYSARDFAPITPTREVDALSKRLDKTAQDYENLLDAIKCSFFGPSNQDAEVVEYFDGLPGENSVWLYKLPTCPGLILHTDHSDYEVDYLRGKIIRPVSGNLFALAKLKFVVGADRAPKLFVLASTPRTSYVKINGERVMARDVDWTSVSPEEIEPCDNQFPELVVGRDYVLSGERVTLEDITGGYLVFSDEDEDKFTIRVEVALKDLEALNDEDDSE